MVIMSDNENKKEHVVLKGVIPPKRKTPEEIDEAIEYLTKRNKQPEITLLSLSEKLKEIVKEQEQTSFSYLSEKIKEIIKENEQHPSSAFPERLKRAIEEYEQQTQAVRKALEILEKSQFPQKEIAEDRG
jgi:FMN phosphatase YigB (HAD superfamily)